MSGTFLLDENCRAKPQHKPIYDSWVNHIGLCKATLAVGSYEIKVQVIKTK